MEPAFGVLSLFLPLIIGYLGWETSASISFGEVLPLTGVIYLPSISRYIENVEHIERTRRADKASSGHPGFAAANMAYDTVKEPLQTSVVDSFSAFLLLFFFVNLLLSDIYLRTERETSFFVTFGVVIIIAAISLFRLSGHIKRTDEGNSDRSDFANANTAYGIETGLP